MVLSTPRLELREWRMDDAQAFLAMYGDAEVMRHTRAAPCADLADAAARLRALIDAVAARGFGHWALVERETGALAGSAGFRAWFADGELEIGFTIARALWGRGYATEIARATLEMGFSRFGAPRIWGLAAPENAASRRVMQKIGMRYVRELEDDGTTWSAYVADRIR
jgi:ribosomal-protein-alanine N-acetyltransferase